MYTTTMTTLTIKCKRKCGFHSLFYLAVSKKSRKTVSNQISFIIAGPNIVDAEKMFIWVRSLEAKGHGCKVRIWQFRIRDFLTSRGSEPLEFKEWTPSLGS